ncbi:MAG TPA: hypothetical protein VGG29_00695 [Caulobacteraceae bacterium]|jgi:hypothetical protein
MKKLLVAACALAALPGASFAQPPGFAHHPGAFHGAGPHSGPHGHFAAGPVAHFGPSDVAAWRGGYWWHGWRSGRLGWWWFADGYWYWYAVPVYPYPDVVAGYAVPGEEPTQTPRTWWYCYSPPGYYPWVRSCAGPWRPMPASPQPPPPGEPPPGYPP